MTESDRCDVVPTCYPPVNVKLYAWCTGGKFISSSAQLRFTQFNCSILFNCESRSAVL